LEPTADPLVVDLEKLLKAGIAGGEYGRVLIDMLPEALKGLNATLSERDVLGAVFGELFQQANSTLARAGREHLGMTRHSYREAYAAVKRGLDSFTEAYTLAGELSEDATDEQEQAQLERLLVDVTPRRILASHELNPREGYNTKTVKNTWCPRIARALADELRSSLRDQTFIDVVISKLGVVPAQTITTTPIPTTPTPSDPLANLISTLTSSPNAVPSATPRRRARSQSTFPRRPRPSTTADNSLSQKSSTDTQEQSATQEVKAGGLVWYTALITLLFASIPLGARLLPPFVEPHTLQVLDYYLSQDRSMAVSLLGILVGCFRFIAPRKFSFSRGVVWIVVFIVAFLNISVRVVVNSDATQLATSINAQIVNWNPVILDNGNFANYEEGCNKPINPTPEDLARHVPVYRLDQDPIPDYIGGYPGERENGANQAYVPADRTVSKDEYQCAQVDGVLRTGLSQTKDDVMVMYPPDRGKPVGYGSYYIETEVHPIGGSHISSCLLGTSQPGSPDEVTAFSIVNANRNDRQGYVAKVFHAHYYVEPNAANVTEPPVSMNDVVQSSDFLPFVLRSSLLDDDDYNVWTKLAVYKSSGKVSFLVNDRVAVTFEDRDTFETFPRLATRAGTASAGGTAACEFRYLRAYSAGK
jgi:hypothetical protein